MKKIKGYAGKKRKEEISTGKADFSNQLPMEPTIFIKGFTTGVVICAPVGPIGLVCVRRTLAHGRMTGLLSMLGASTVDVLYCSIAGLGITWVSRFLIQNNAFIQLFGSLGLLLLGLWLFVTDPREEAPQKEVKGLIRAYCSTFLLMLANPMPILMFTAAFTALGIHGWKGNYASTAMLTAGVLSGSALWAPILVAAASLFRQKCSHWQFRIVNRASGAIIFIFGAVLGSTTLFR